jgi:GNAT superfamily N-acetyltransferase
VRTKLTVTRQEIAVSSQIVPVDPVLKEQMIEIFLEAFEDSVEFCDWSLDSFHTHVRKNINNYFQGVRGKPHPVSRMALEPNSTRLIGLALFVENKAESFRSGLSCRNCMGGFPAHIAPLPTMETTQAQERVELDLLLVKPSHQRMGIATQMVASAINSLDEDGINELRSGYHICNEGSRAWHRKLGFEDIPEYLYCRFQYSWYRHEIWRREELGQIDRLEELKTEKDRWERLGKHFEMWESY